MQAGGRGGGGRGGDDVEGMYYPGWLPAGISGGTEFTCFTGTKVQILTRIGARSGTPNLQQVFSLLALLVQMYKY
jgi:hypothetical protein